MKTKEMGLITLERSIHRNGNVPRTKIELVRRASAVFNAVVQEAARFGLEVKLHTTSFEVTEIRVTINMFVIGDMIDLQEAIDDEAARY